MALLKPGRLGFEDVEFSSGAERRQIREEREKEGEKQRERKRDLPLGQAKSSQKN